MNIDSIKNGLVIDHIHAGGAMRLYNLLGLGYVDPGITVNVIRGGELVEKKQLSLPERLENVLRCRNPRCITSVEPGLKQVFFLSDRKSETYRCIYCEAKAEK